MRRLGMTLLLGAARGALNVVLAGAMAGVVGGLILFALARWLPKPPWLRGLTFSAVCYLVAIPGFRPPQPLVFALFAPVFLAYGFTVVMLCARVVDRPAPGQRTVPPSA